MKVTNEKVENSQAFLTVEMEPAEVETYLQKSYERLVKRANIPGFRKGKAPRTVLERHLGRESLLNDALDLLLPEAYEKALKEQSIEAIAHPQIEITRTDPVVFKAVVPLKPQVKLGEYQKIKVEEKTIEVTEKDVDAVIERLRHQHATWEPVERPIEFGDLLALDVWSSIENKPYLNQKSAQYQVLQDSAFPAPGFAGQLVGMKKDDEKEFKLSFPADYPNKELAEKEASFRVRINEIKQENLPEVNDDFAKTVNAELQTVDALRERVLSDLNLRAEEDTRADFEERVIDAAVEVAELEFPPVLVEMEIDRIINRQMERWQRTGGGLEDYLKSLNKTEKELREELRPFAEKRVRRALILDRVSEEEKIEVSDSEIEAEVGNMVKHAAENSKEELRKLLNSPQAHESIKETLITRKTIERLTTIARGSDEAKKSRKKEEGK